ncbi:response regulator transcription factor [Pseudonocardia humida]|uniref:Response regulator n=1 Tax=Pseudonocardia humida TaxID=2800819 RepID=A0ABT1A811_9PSEU|nr:response regulator [Pseudonocardia humida]MCO1659158.1 response regulator [Pseudonocardia humida]
MTVATALLDRPADRPRSASRVLLVDGDGDGRRAKAAAMRAAGLEVTAVPDPAQALAVLGAVRPDVLITDMSRDALELVQVLRVRGAAVPTLTVGSRTDRVAAFQAGADAFLAVPFGPAELLDRVADLASPSAA